MPGIMEARCYPRCNPSPSGSEVLDVLQRFVTNEVARNGYLAIFLLMVLGSACVPIPSEVVMAFGGALASSTFAAQALEDPGKQLSLALVVVVGVVATLAGSWLAYWAGYAGGRPLIDRWGRYLLLRPHEVDRAHAWFERHGQGAVLFARLVPLVRAFISLPAGVARMDFGRFTLYTLIGVVPWTLGFALAGYGLGESWDEVERFMRPVSILFGLALVVAVAWWVARRLRERRGADEPAEPLP